MSSYVTDEDKKIVAQGICPYCKKKVSDDSELIVRELLTQQHVQNDCVEWPKVRKQRATGAAAGVARASGDNPGAAPAAAGAGPTQAQKMLDFQLAGFTRGWTKDTP